MPTFITGDELGSVKTVTFTRTEGKEWKSEVVSVRTGDSKAQAIQKMTLDVPIRQLATAHADGSIYVSSLDGDKGEPLQWKESRLKDNQGFVGLASTGRSIYSCTSNGALRLTTLDEERQVSSTHTAVLPMRLSEFRLAHNSKTFAYAGDEVELSVWDAERAFDAPAASIITTDESSIAKKRKRTEPLLPGEIWRAKNLPNDNLNLRQPVRNTALTYLQSSSTGTNHLLVGTQFGDVRRYDTRSARRPVSNWKGISKVGAIATVDAGLHDNEAFVSDHGCNLFALDLRNGKVVYGYKGIAGAVTTIAPSPTFLASGASDRYLRLHSAFPPPARVGDQQEEKGEVLEKLYMKVTPTVVLWDGQAGPQEEEADPEREEDEVWAEMEEADSDEEATNVKKSKRQ